MPLGIFPELFSTSSAPKLRQKNGPPIGEPLLSFNRLTPNSAEVRERLGGRYIGVDYQDLIFTTDVNLLGLCIDAQGP